MKIYLKTNERTVCIKAEGGGGGIEDWIELFKEALVGLTFSCELTERIMLVDEGCEERE